MSFADRRSSIVDPHHHLYDNLVLLHELRPGSSDFHKCLKEDMFKKPNRTGFDQTLFYLCHTYDPTNYRTKVTWPVVERSQERPFRQNTVAFIKQIIKERPEARIPSFSPSFLSTPGGDRLAKFLWKFSLLVLSKVVQEENVDAVLEYPTSGLQLVEAMTEANLQDIAKIVNDLCCLLLDASSYSGKLKNEIMNQAMELKMLRSELYEVVQNLEACPLSQEEKRLLTSDNSPQFDTVIHKWQSLVTQGAEDASGTLEIMKAQSSGIADCFKSVKALVDSKTMPVVLDASDYSSIVKDQSGNLDLAHLLTAGSNAASTIVKTISMYGGLHSLHSVLPALENMRAQLESIQNSFAETKSGYVDLISSSCNSMISPILRNVGEESPLKGSLKLGWEMLQDAQKSTPPLVFNVHGDVPSKSRISFESPPLTGVAGWTRPSMRARCATDNGAVFTPKMDKVSLGASSKVSKILHLPSAPKRDVEPFQAGLKTPFSPLEHEVVQTPANFNSKLLATSTACKPTAAISNGIPKWRSAKKEIKTPMPQNNSPKSFQSKNSEQAYNTCISSKVLPSVDMILEQRTNVSREVVEEKDDKISALKKSEMKNMLPCLTQEASVRISACVRKSGKNFPIMSPKITSGSFQDSFDSPRSSLGIFSPPSADNSFFASNVLSDNVTISAPKFDLQFEDDISPSGRVSLCPSADIQEAQNVKEPLDTTSKAVCLEVPSSNIGSKRRSLQALISRYREVVASSKQFEVTHVSPVSSPEPIVVEDAEENFDFNLSLDL